MTGASGLVGRALCAELAREGATFRVLSRDPDRARRLVPSAGSYHLWQPIERGNVAPELVEEARAIVHLASPLTLPGRGEERRREVYDACVMGTRGVVSSLVQATSRPEVLVCASSVSYYALDATGEHVAGEEEAAGSDFLSRLTRDWENEAMRAEEFGVRTVVLRSALVLGVGGALPRLRRAAWLGFGGPVPSGRQLQPWIHVEDEVGLLLLALACGDVSGAMNAVAPQAVTNSEFMAVLRAALGVPAGVRQPQRLLHSWLGAGAMAVTQGRGAAPTRATALGYEFRQPQLEAGLRGALAARR